MTTAGQNKPGLYLEIVAWSTFVGFLFPISFLIVNRDAVSKAVPFSVMIGIIFVFCVVAAFLANGQLFQLKSLRFIRISIYSWGVAMLFVTTGLVYISGGVQSSIFVWLFEYAFIVSVVLRPTWHESFTLAWRPALVVGSLEIIAIIGLALLADRAVPISESLRNVMGTWGALSITSAIGASYFVFKLAHRKLHIEATGDRGQTA